MDILIQRPKTINPFLSICSSIGMDTTSFHRSITHSYSEQLFQFYGYYVPEENNENQAAPYLSPILLLENCGIPIDPEALNQDDKEECASLLYRLHEAGWIHGSYAARNILTQPGPLSEWPPFRILGGVKSFRLIDFGRSSNCSSSSRAMEEMTANQLCHIAPY